MRDQLQPIYRSETTVCLGCGKLLFLIALGSPVASEFPDLRKACLGFIASQPEGVAMVLVVPERIAPPEAAVRKALSELYSELTGHLQLVVGVFHGRGFITAAVRGFFSFLLLAGRRVPSKTFTELTPALEWAATRSGESLDAARIGSQLEAMLPER